MENYEKKTEKREINYEVINKDKIDSKLLVEDVTLDTDTVYVKASEATLAKVASVKALVNLDDYDGALYYFKKASEINEQDGRLKELKSLIEKNKATLKK